MQTTLDHYEIKRNARIACNFALGGSLRSASPGRIIKLIVDDTIQQDQSVCVPYPYPPTGEHFNGDFTHT